MSEVSSIINIPECNCRAYIPADCTAVFWWGTSAQHGDSLARTIELLREAGHHSVGVITFAVKDWNADFSPWEAEQVASMGPFAGNGKLTVKRLVDEVIPAVEARLVEEGVITAKALKSAKRFLVGYSLSGLFSIWAHSQVEAFDGCASVSGSLWFPGWMEHLAATSFPANSKIYLSLGSKEEMAPEPVMASVGDATRKTYANLKARDDASRVTLEWTKGGHFADAAKRMTKAITWLAKNSLT